MAMDLGCVEFATPGKTLEEKLRILEFHGMWLELANDGRRRAEDIIKIQRSFKTPIKSVQAYRQHEISILSADAGEREAAIRHVEESIELASAIEAQNVVAVITYGAPRIDNPRKACVELLRCFGKLGEDLGVTVSIEPLGRARTPFLPSAYDVLQLIREVESEHVRLMVDTMHIYLNGQDPAKIIDELVTEISEVQLRDTDSKPPGRGKIDFGRVLKVIHGKFGGLVCLEFQPGPNPELDFENARRIWDRVRVGK